MNPPPSPSLTDPVPAPDLSTIQLHLMAFCIWHAYVKSYTVAGAGMPDDPDPDNTFRSLRAWEALPEIESHRWLSVARDMIKQYPALSLHKYPKAAESTLGQIINHHLKKP